MNVDCIMEAVRLDLWRAARFAVLVAIVYVGVSCFAFALRHPELTDTQRFFGIWDAVLWR